jgi:hypothetical protein
MKPFDERLPEEQDPQYEELITLLRQANLNPLFVEPTRRAQLLARAKARLMQADSHISQPKDLPVPELSDLGSIPSRPKAPVDKKLQYRRLIRLVNLLAAVLVVLALIGSVILIFGPRSPVQKVDFGSAPPIGPVGAPVTIDTQTGGLEVTMRITRGPYFLNELLAVDLSLMNHTHSTFLLQGWAGYLCSGPFKVTMTGGESQNGTNLVSNQANQSSCNAGANTLQLQPGHTLSSSQYIALMRSGHLTLTVQATFQKVALQDGVIQMVPTTDPLEGHWPSLKMTVQKLTPSDRSLALHQQGSQVSIPALPVALHQLLYMSVYDCDLGRGPTQHGGTEQWTKLSAMTLQKPSCGFSEINGTPTPGKLVRWMYAIGAPGYGIRSGTYPS